MPQTSVLAAPAAAIAGQLADTGRDMNLASYFSQEASLQMQFGSMVMQGAADYGANILTAGNVAKMLGVVVYDASYQKGNELGAVADANGKLGILPNVTFNVLKRGRIWVLCEEAVTPADVVRVRCTNAGNGAGTFRKTSAGAGLSMLLVGARWLDSAGVGGFARVEFDVLARNTYTAD
jgi:hypothetical protein